MKASQPGADQPHVVVKGQPTDEDVVGPDLEHLAHDPDVGEQVGVAQHDALGISGTARGVLQECGVPGAENGHGKPTWDLFQLVGGDHVAQGFDLGTEQAGKGACFGDGDHDGAPAVGDDGGVAAQVFLDVGGTSRGIDGNRNAAGQ